MVAKNHGGTVVRFKADEAFEREWIAAAERIVGRAGVERRGS